jgi:hypothetical protein
LEELLNDQDFWNRDKTSIFDLFDGPLYALMSQMGCNNKGGTLLQKYLKTHFMSCATCNTQCPCVHNPDVVDLDECEKVFVRIPVLKRDGKVIKHAYIFPLVTLYRLLLASPDVLQSLVTEPTKGVKCTLGKVFEIASRHCNAQGVAPLALDLYTDKATVVRVGQRSLWPIYARIANSTLSHASVTVVVGLIPILGEEEFHLVSAANLRDLRLGVYQVTMAAVCWSGLLYAEQPDLEFKGQRYRCFCLVCAADSKDHYKSSGIKEGSCFRCYKNADGREQLFSERYGSIVTEIQQGAATKKTVMKSAGLRSISNFTIGLSFFDLSINGGVCFLHSHSLWSKKICKWIGAIAARLSSKPGRGRRARDRELTLMEQV